MDGDGSHPAAVFSNLWERRGGADLVIASRFMLGGSANLPWLRHAASRLLNILTRRWLGFPVRDASSGLRLYRAATVKGLVLSARDFSIQQEILIKILGAGGRVSEIPFHYEPRFGGRSKAPVLSLAFSYLRLLLAPLCRPEVLALVVALALGLVLGLWGIGWGLPGPQRLRAFPERLRPNPEIAARFSEGWSKLYEEIRRSHKEMRPEEPVTYVQGREEIAPGWEFPPEKLANSYRSLLLQSESPDEKKSFIILSQMRPWDFEFKPSYIFYGGAFIYPLGVFLKILSWAGALAGVSELPHYLQNPQDMGRLYLCGRLFILLFHLGSLCLLYDLGRRLSGWRTGLSAALFFALCPVVVVQSHILKPHAYAVFWILCAVRWLLKAGEGGARSDYRLCGLCAGVAAGANFSLVLFLALPGLAWLWRCGSKTVPGEGRHALCGLLSSVAVILATNPYLVLSYGEFAWDRQYVSRGLRLTFQGLPAMAAAAWQGMGVGLAALAMGGAAMALARPGERRLVAIVFWVALSFLWAQFWSLAGDVGCLRLYLSVMALACLMGADLLWSGRWPRSIKLLVLIVLLSNSAAGSLVFLHNMQLDSGSGSTRERATDWIERNIPPGTSIGLLRYPEPAHTPPFRYDLYHLTLFDRPEALDPTRLPEYLVLDEEACRSVDKWSKKHYDLLIAFVPAKVAWARLTDYSTFINGPMFVYRRKTSGLKPT
jgi:hypothetical protein